MNPLLRLRANRVVNFPPARDVNTEPPPAGPPAEPEVPPPEVIETQTETTTWLSTLSQTPSEFVISAINTFIFRMKACGAHAALIDYGVGAAGTQESSLQGIKGFMNASDWTVINGTVEWEELYGFHSDNGARISYDPYTFANIPGISLTSFGLGVGLTTNVTGIICEMGAFDATTGFQVTLRGSGGINSQARLGGSAQVFGDANSVGFTYAAKLATDSDPYAGTYCSDSFIYPASGVPAGLPDSKLCMLAGGLTGNTLSTSRINNWYVGALTPQQMLLVRDAQSEFYNNLGIAEEIDVPIVVPGPNAFTKTTIDSVFPSNLRVLQFSLPPSSNTTDYQTYNAFPITDFHTRFKPSLNSSTWTAPRNGRAWQFVWVNNGERDNDINGNPVGDIHIGRRWNDPNGSVNPVTGAIPNGGAITINGVVCAVVYSTKKKARYATLALVAWHCGHLMRDDPDDPRGWGVLDYVEAGGMPASAWQTQDYWSTNKLTVFTESVDSKFCARDIIMPGYYRMSDCTSFANRGIFFDHEPADFPDGSVWSSGTSYVVGQPATFNYLSYQCLIAHVAGSSFNDDLIAGKWQLVDGLHLDFLRMSGEITACKGYHLSTSAHPLDSSTIGRDGFNKTSCPVLMQDPNYTWYAVDARRNDLRGYSPLESVKKQVGLATAPLIGTKTFDPPSLNNGDTTTTTVSVPGVVMGQTVYAPSFSASLRQTVSGATGCVQLSAVATADDEITVTFTNNTGVTQNLSSGTLTVYAQGPEPIDYSKVQLNAVIGVGAGQTSEADMMALREWVVSNGVGMVYASPSGARRGGTIDDPAQRLRAILYGLPLS